MPFASDWFLDQFLNSIINSIVEYYVNDTAPTTFAECATSALVGPIAMTPADFAAIGDAASGRKTSVNQKDDQNITSSGLASDVSMRDDGTNSAFYTTPLASTQTLTAGGTVTITPWDIEIEDPVNI